ncbi:hypothetical protein AK830_g5486 [Neonectria ditissima]|uniref:Uncharacterized protein n=1 Tax=Neonectria ditissima TaxID=78410 RepID=A0A0N8H786_9HYPO|nr:hypothetical protein AK830_g5486 [Neonectria ditissima]
MSTPVQYDGFWHIPLSQELQDTLRSADQSPITSSQLKKLPYPGIDLRESPWNNEKLDAARKVIVELTSYIKNWPEKENFPKNWEGKDLTLFEGALCTEEDQRDIYIPRQLQPDDAQVIIHNKQTGSTRPLTWDESYVYMLEAGVRVIVVKGPIRFFLLAVKCKQQGK